MIKLIERRAFVRGVQRLVLPLAGFILAKHGAFILAHWWAIGAAALLCWAIFLPLDEILSRDFEAEAIARRELRLDALQAEALAKHGACPVSCPYQKRGEWSDECPNCCH